MVYVAGAAVVRGGEPAEASLEELVFEAAAAYESMMTTPDMPLPPGPPCVRQ